MSRNETAGEGIAEFVKRLKPEAREAFLSLRALTLSLGPDVTETVVPGGVSYARRGREFVRVEAERTRLTATFPPEARLDDPGGRLLRRGDARWVRVDAREGRVDAHVQDFVRRAHAALR